MADYLDHLCEFLCEADFDALPDTVHQRAALVTADTIAAIVAGSDEPEMRALTGSMLNTSTGNASVLGTGLRAGADVAGFLNGSAGTFLELDEGNRFSRGHPAVHVLPALLGAAETAKTTGREFLHALILGYEVSARIGIGAKLRASTHPHGTWGTVGAAVAVARLARANQAQMREVINVSASLGLANSAQSMYEGALVRNTFAGFSARAGLTAWQLVLAGFNGEKDCLSSIWGEVLSDNWRKDALTANLGTTWEITRNYFKLHACCRYNHAALDALGKIHARHELVAAEVQRVEVTTYSLAASLSEPAPKNTLAGKFSVPFSIATTIVNGSSGIRSFAWDAIQNEAVKELATRVTVREDLDMTALLPDLRPAHVTVVLKDGTVLEASTQTNRGDFEDPYEPDEIKLKFLDLTTRIWSVETAEALWQRLRVMEQLRDVNEVTRPLDT